MPEQPDASLRLITVSISHFCEKARWALDRLNLPYREERHAPVFHYPFRLLRGGKRTVPVLVSQDGVLADSTDILQYLDRFAPPGVELYPSHSGERLRVLELERAARPGGAAVRDGGCPPRRSARMTGATASQRCAILIRTPAIALRLYGRRGRLVKRSRDACMSPPTHATSEEMPPRTTVLLLGLLVACAPRTPRVADGPLTDGLDGFLAGHVPADGQSIRVDEIGRTAGASYHVVQLRGSEIPHRHVVHDLTVFVLRGRGTLTLGGRGLALTAGDAAVIPRGAVHWFAREGRASAVALVVFTPPLDAPDVVPAELR